MNTIKQMDATQYQKEAQVTLSHSFFGEYFEIGEVISALNDAIIAAARLDRIKKGLFYGRGIETASPIPTGSLSHLQMTGTEETLFHGILGTVTEAGEQAEILRNFIAQFASSLYDDSFTRQPRPQFDTAHILEESGDVLWYEAIKAEAMETHLTEVMAVNIAKLRKRFKAKFDAFDANNRDLAGERAAMGDDSKGAQDSVHFTAHNQLVKADDELERSITAQPRDGLSHEGMSGGCTRSYSKRIE